jgi:hypothetical protein
VGPLIPFRYFAIPLGLIYSFGYWIVYIHATECDVSIFEAIVKYISYVVLTGCVAHATESMVHKAYEQKEEPQSML